VLLRMTVVLRHITSSQARARFTLFGELLLALRFFSPNLQPKNAGGSRPGKRARSSQHGKGRA